MSTINCKGKLVDLSSPKVMGILNITPDSFFDGGKYKDEISILNQVDKMLQEGADFIDVGAYSSRPGAFDIPEEEELRRIIPVIKLLLRQFPETIISVDTFRSNVAKNCIEKGASIINDISGGNLDSNMFETAVSLQVPYIALHMQGNPQNMQDKPTYKNIVQEIVKDFSKKKFMLNSMGLNDLIFDVGFGFGKTIEHNYELLDNIDFFQNLDCPIIAGISRKSMLYKPLGISPSEALNATSVANTIALQKGVQILRVHDVKEAVEAIKIIELVSNYPCKD